MMYLSTLHASLLLKQKIICCVFNKQFGLLDGQKNDYIVRVFPFVQKKFM